MGIMSSYQLRACFFFNHTHVILGVLPFRGWVLFNFRSQFGVCLLTLSVFLCLYFRETTHPFRVCIFPTKPPGTCGSHGSCLRQKISARRRGVGASGRRDVEVQRITSRFPLHNDLAGPVVLAAQAGEAYAWMRGRGAVGFVGPLLFCFFRRQNGLADGHGSKPMVPFWDRCTTYCSLFQWGVGCSLGLRDFDPWPYGCGSKIGTQPGTLVKGTKD